MDSFEIQEFVIFVTASDETSDTKFLTKFITTKWWTKMAEDYRFLVSGSFTARESVLIKKRFLKFVNSKWQIDWKFRMAVQRCRTKIYIYEVIRFKLWNSVILKSLMRNVAQLADPRLRANIIFKKQFHSKSKIVIFGRLQIVRQN